MRSLCTRRRNGVVDVLIVRVQHCAPHVGRDFLRSPKHYFERGGRRRGSSKVGGLWLSCLGCGEGDALCVYQFAKARACSPWHMRPFLPAWPFCNRSRDYSRIGGKWGTRVARAHLHEPLTYVASTTSSSDAVNQLN